MANAGGAPKSPARVPPRRQRSVTAMLKRRVLSVLHRFSVVAPLVLAAVIASILNDDQGHLPRVAIPIPPPTEPRIVRPVCREGKVTVTPVPHFARPGEDQDRHQLGLHSRLERFQLTGDAPDGSVP